MVLIDTSIWVPALRRGEAPEKREVDWLLSQDEAATTDFVVAEVLQGARNQEDFEKLAMTLDSLHYFHANKDIWRQAAELSFQLQRRGQTTALSDLVIAAVALRHDLELYATDSDFDRVAELRRYRERP
jgi:predicted nucleic acid-binding protein